ncbi:hypothetical protein [Nitrospirillum amazonense]|uniref:Uncharacterized protein n=1 Tax=Nitrospirillum amazonense TaxID=28077 RepID=A0A560KIP9_9PROT|nr:hypothetical protein [Nitrospirillum amazonense]MDG3439549.1 hypothetical protein [Nitrospirillum amazonense]TWB83087.1 hypothetical protein FBZ87_101801 [Nitrospirillum amazonense]
MTNEKSAKAAGRIAAKVWAGEGFRAWLLADPAAVRALALSA